MRPLTKRQQQIVHFIRQYTKKRGYPPAMMEIAAHLGVTSSATISDHLRALERKGFMKRVKGRSRGLELIAEDSSLSPEEIPILKPSPPGKPFFQPKNFKGTVPVKNTFFRYKNLFSFEVKENDMKGAAIHKGDFLIIRHQNSVNSNEIALILQGEKLVVRRVLSKGKKISLSKEGAKIQLRQLKESEFLIVLGKVVGLVRREF